MKHKTGLTQLLNLIAVAVCSLFLFCDHVNAIELMIVNDLLPDDSGSMLEIENARCIEAPDNKIAFKVPPGVTKKITWGNVTSFVLVRVFPSHKLKYEISCNNTAKGSAKITLLQAHNNQLPLGCTLLRSGHWSKKTGMSWGTL